MNTPSDEERSIRAGLASNDLARITAAVSAAVTLGAPGLFDALLAGGAWSDLGDKALSMRSFLDAPPTLPPVFRSRPQPSPAQLWGFVALIALAPAASPVAAALRAQLQSLWLGVGETASPLACDLTPLAQLPALQRLRLDRIARPVGLLASLRSLRELEVFAPGDGAAIELPGHPALEEAVLWLSSGQRADLTGCPRLRALTVRAGRGATVAVTGCAALKKLTLRGAGEFGGFDRGASAGLTLVGLASTGLRTLHADGASAEGAEAALRDVDSLEAVQAEGLDLTAALADLARQRRLRTLVLRRCGPADDLSPLAAARSLQRLELRLCRGVRALEPLAGLPKLERLVITAKTAVIPESLRAITRVESS